MSKLFKYKRAWILILIPISVIMMILAINSSFIAEYIFARGIFRFLTYILSIFTRFLPFSLMEIAILLMIPFFITIIAIFLYKIIKNKNRRKTIVTKAILDVFVVISVAMFMFCSLDAVNYYRYSIAHYLNLEVTKSTKEELYDLCVELAHKVNTAREDIICEDENGVMEFKGSFNDTALVAMQAMKKLSDKYPSIKAANVKPKQIMLSKYMSYTNLVGIYCPYTLEANVNTDIPDYNTPADMCHELAHLHGIIKEDEANYVSYLACTQSEDEEFVYSGYIMAFIYASNQLYDINKMQYFEVCDILNNDVHNDLRANSEYWSALEENEIAVAVSNTTSNINDAYLKANGQEDGVLSYGRMVDLLLAEYKKSKLQ